MKVRITHSAAEHDEPKRYAVDLEVENDATLIVGAGDDRCVVSIREIKRLLDSRNQLLETVKKARRTIPGFEDFEKTGEWPTAEKTPDDIETCLKRAHNSKTLGAAVVHLANAVNALHRRDENRREAVSVILTQLNRPAVYQHELVAGLREALETLVSP